ncbi:MAG: DegV family protein [Anaerolineales bacterium]|jgi:DegV family protein with EDD domain
MNTAIVTDSTADVPSELAEMMHISVIPAILMLGEQSFEDGNGITREEFYLRLPEMSQLPTTGTPAVGTFENVYQHILDQGFHNIISIHVASTLSGIYNTAQLASENFKGFVTVIDSESLSMGIGFQVIAAAEASLNNLSTEAILKTIETTRKKTKLFAMLDSLEYVHRSGRVGWTRARIGSLLRIKPFVEVNAGKVFNMGQARTRKKGIDHLQEILTRQGNLLRLAILHTNAEEDAHAFLQSLEINIPPDPLIVNVTTVIGTHVGPNALGFAAVLR